MIFFRIQFGEFEEFAADFVRLRDILEIKFLFGARGLDADVSVIEKSAEESHGLRGDVLHLFQIQLRDGAFEEP